MDLIYELRIISIVFLALAIVFLSLVLFSVVIANAQVARLYSIIKATLCNCKLFIYLCTYIILGLYLPVCVNLMPQKRSQKRGEITQDMACQVLLFVKSQVHQGN